MSGPVHYPWLDLARGVSALLVVAGHARAAFFSPLSAIKSPTYLELFFYAITSLGALAVIAFFVLSGFLVGGSIVRAGERFDLRDYFVARLCRLWIVLVPALLLTLAADSLTARVAPSALSGAFFEQWHSGPDPAVGYSVSLSTLLGNLAFLQTIVVPVFGTNGPLWSLSCEFWYYVCFPFLVVGLTTVRRHGLPVGAVVAFATVYFMPPGMLQGFCVWLMGVVAFVVVHRMQRMQRPVRTRWIIFSCILLLLAIAYDKSGRLRSLAGIPTELAFGAAFSGVVISIARLDSGRRPASWRRVVLGLGEALSRVSYSLYLCHFPVLVLVAATLFPASLGRLSWLGGAIYMLALALLCGVAVGFWFLFERHTNSLRAFVTTRINVLVDSRR